MITNLTNTDQNVVYTVTPTSTNSCVGTDFFITITVKPEPVGVSMAAPDICSGTSVGYDLQNNVNTLPGNGLLANFTWTATSNPNVTGETTSLKSGSIIDDVLVNTTTSDETVTYTVTPIGQAGGCAGNPFTITVKVNPKAIFSAGPDLSVCVADGSKVLGGTSSFVPGGLLWTGGTGTIVNPTSANATYVLSPSDLAVSSPLNITLTLTAGASGACAPIVDQMVLTVNPQPIVVFTGFPAGAPPQMAENNAPITLTGNQAGGIFTISPATSNIGSTVASPVDKASFDPAAVDLGSNFVTYTYTDPNGCTNSDTQEVVVNPVTNVDFTMQYTTGSAPFPFVPINALGEFELCGNVGPVKLVGNPVASTGLPPETQFTSIPAYAGGPVASISFDGTDYFLQTNGLVSDRYRVLYTYKNAFNAITTKIRDVKIFASPVAQINVLNSCIDSAIDFTDGSTLPATPFPATITGWQWNFADGFFSNQQNPSHNYVSSGLYNVGLTVSTSQGCTNFDTQSIRVGDVPEVAYDWSAICNNDNTKFLDKTSKVVGGTPPGISTITTYTWDFGDGDVISGIGAIPPGTNGGRTTGTFKDPEHKYASFGTYDTQLTVDTDDGCNNALIQKVFILPFSTVTPLATSAYNEDFELTNGGWIAESTAPSDTSWIWGVPTGATIATAASGTNVWWTGKNGNTYFPNEKSVVNGPCFNLTQLDRPMVSLDYWADMENNVDGAVLQYSTDGGITWNIVGPPVGQINRDEGINWFNGVTIPSNPGAQPLGSYGWTNKLGGWKNGRFNLDMVPAAERDQVRLRIAFASNDFNPSADTYDGFAFDNVFVGNKKRNVLVEHFTNSALAPTTSGDTYLDNRLADQFALRAVSDFSDIRYHISYPSPDAINLENPTDPGARASYYNVSQAPATIMDGKLDDVDFKGSFLDITNIEIDRRALVDPLFNIVLDTLPTNNSNTITARLAITANTAFSEPLIAQIALVEKNVGGAKNVVRKHLLGADGAAISTPWTVGQTLVQSRADVAINVPISDGSQLVLVGYVQDKNSREIHQSMVIGAPIKRGSVVVGIDEDEPFDPIFTQITMYPNPAKGEVSFGLPSKGMEGYAWKIADQRGVLMLQGTFEGARDEVLPVDITSLPNGVYHVIITGRNNSATYKKLVVMNRN
ncbi:MAG: PKD domain-containing protein [Cyclobacteriaceae bacterium]|nr:PKD domain-containing protein [Cyclobacteriaceae bacterium]MCW5903291.1 PKD domain-containing protein [Cyclobacteriaceae bacterium]